MAAITIFLQDNRISEYEFGYSEFDNIATVVNWQNGNNIFTSLPDGTYFVFARLIGSSSFIKSLVSVNCDGCTVAARGFFDITPNTCRLDARGFFDITESAPANTGILIIGLDL